MIRLLHQMIARAADRDADAPAFRFLDETLSYGALDAKSDQVAAVLSEHGVRKGDRVGLYLNKSLETAISLYGVMKAGGVYVPLDPAAPAERTRMVMKQCGMSAFITHAPKAQDATEVLESYDTAGLACIIGVQSNNLKSSVLGWDDLGAGLRAPENRVLDQDLAYIIFTSGSTGEPKGIMHTHRSGRAYAEAAAVTYDVCSTDRLSNHSPLHFDMSTFDYLCGPHAGACTVIVSEAHAKLPASLSKLIQDEQLTHWYSVPFALIQLLQHGALDQRDLSALRWVMFGGEPFPAKYLSALIKSLPQTRFSNVYGPAEVNQCTYHHVTESDLADDRPPPIGRVWDHAEGIVLDENDDSVMAGETGELAIRSSTMMRGYWGRKDLNAGAFYKRSLGGGFPDYFYRTGDLVTDEGGGVLRFIGRKDRQVKVRGFRVELDEVEAALSLQDKVGEAAAILLKDADGAAAIIAAATLKGAYSADIETDILTAVARKLPRYAVPQQLVVIDTFPRTTSGKIDKRALARDLEERRLEKETADAR
ncbi:MAG: amino acid adenylation domain-containing protein [Pseudomonadota bacterium]